MEPLALTCPAVTHVTQLTSANEFFIPLTLATIIASAALFPKFGSHRRATPALNNTRVCEGLGGTLGGWGGGGDADISRRHDKMYHSWLLKIAEQPLSRQYIIGKRRPRI
jgi:hypothetical protein